MYGHGKKYKYKHTGLKDPIYNILCKVIYNKDNIYVESVASNNSRFA